MPEQTQRIDRCPTCRAADVDQIHAARCKLLDHASAAAVKHGRDANGGPIHGQKSRDLWAHFNTRLADPEAARDLVVNVIDLGWRPVVGKHDIWSPVTPPAPTTDPRAEEARKALGESEESA